MFKEGIMGRKWYQAEQIIRAVAVRRISAHRVLSGRVRLRGLVTLHRNNPAQATNMRKPLESYAGSCQVWTNQRTGS
jgi:hypothetical protein